MEVTPRQILDQVVDHRDCGDETIVLDGLDDAIIGIDDNNRAVYCERSIIEVLQDQGMDAEAAQEFYEYNVLRALPYMGECAPLIVTIFNTPEFI